MEAWFQALRPLGASASRLRLNGRRIYLPATLRGYPRSTNAWVALTYPVPPSVITVGTWYRNINLLAIAYACRPRLRSRLTLGRLALPRNPWAFGGDVSRVTFVTHTGILSSQASTAGLSPPLPRPGNALLPLQLALKSTASVASLSPVTLSAQEHLTSELLRTLSRVAASRQTSWLSLYSYLLNHLAIAWGP